MKNINFISFIILAFILVSCERKPSAGQSTTEQGTKLNYAKDIKPLEFKADQLNAYIMVPPPTLNEDLLKKTSQQILAISDAKGLKLVPEKNNSRESQYMGLRVSDDPSGIFEINRINGRIIFNRGMKNYKSDKATEGLPNEEAAVERVQAFLKQLPGDITSNELSKPEVSFLEMSSQKDQEPAQIYRKMVTVRYNRIMDNLPIEGKTRLVFSLGQDGELTYMLHDWPKWKGSPIPTDGLFEPKELEKRIADKVIRATKDGKDILVEKRHVVLYDDGAGRMEPAVYVQARYTKTQKGPDGKDSSISVPYDFYEPIMKNTAALYPHVKDQNLKNTPAELKEDQRNTAPDILDKEDE